MSSRILMIAAALAASMGAASAASATTVDANAYEVCAVYGSTVDPRFCADYVNPAARWVDPVETGGVEAGTYVVAPNAGGHIMPWKPSTTSWQPTAPWKPATDGLLVEVITP